MVDHDTSDDSAGVTEDQARTAADLAEQGAEQSGSQEAAQAASIASAAVQSGTSVARAAQSGSPSDALGAAGSAAGGAAAAAAAAGGSQAAQTTAQAAQATQQAAGMASQVAGVTSPAGGSTPSPSAQAPSSHRGSPSATSDTPASPAMEVLEEVGELLGMGAPQRLENVSIEFALTNGSDIAWRVKRFSAHAELSRIYEVHLDVVCDDVDAPIDEMLGAPCELLVERDELLKTIYGIVDEIDDVGPEQDRLHASVRVVPAFALLEDQVDTRIFQGLTVVEILSEVLTEALGVYEREIDVETCIKREYNKRDYCTQFRESTLDFCCRLMQEEGIAFFFASDDENHREKLVLIDNNNDYPHLVLRSGQDEVPVIDSDPEEAEWESVRGVVWRQRRHINKISGRAYNFKAADTFDEHEAARTEAFNHHDQELYLHDLHRQITDDPVEDRSAESFDGTGLVQRQRLVEQTLEQHTAQTKTGYGTGNVTGLWPGVQFRLGAHHRPDLDGAQLLVVRANLMGENTSDGTVDTVYSNEFTVIPIEHEFRPPRRIRRPKVYGPQLARVVGLANTAEEIHVDKHGRIRVQFLHDRLAPADDTASCWVRVMQPWAGPRWGSFFIPRVGMEVVIQFVDGNPDQPVVVGTLYNSVNEPPYTMPDEKTKSTIKTSSSLGGDGYNELTFEDAAGDEEIIVHAQKDFNKTVLNNQSRSVGANDSTSVGGDQSLSVTGERTHAVEGNETITITGSQKVTISGASTGEEQTVTGGQLDITGEYKVDASESIDIKAPNYIELRVGDTFIKIEPDKITMQQKDGCKTVLSPDSALMASKENSQVVLTGDAQMQANTGGDLTLTANAQMTGKDAQVLLDGEAMVKAAKGGEVKLNADATMSGKTARVDGDNVATISGGSEATLTASGSTVKTAAAGADVSGPQVNISGSGAVNVTGGIIKLN